MAKYHVNCNPNNGIISAGTINKKGDKWMNCSVVTEEALLAVREHFLWAAAKENLDNIGYRWDLEDGSAISLELKIDKDPPELKEREETEEVSE